MAQPGHHLSKLNNLFENQIGRLFGSKGRYEDDCENAEIKSALFRFSNVSHKTTNHIDSSRRVSLTREVKVAYCQRLGNVRSQNTRVERDLGFQGRLGDYVILSYGDNMFRDKEGTDKFIGMTCNAAGLACTDPTQVFDPLLDENNQFPRCFLKPSEEYGENCSEDALGITNVVETSYGKGLFFFLLNHRPNQTSTIVGAGVAQVSLSSTITHHPILCTQRVSRAWWSGETEPWYGDICSIRVTNDATDYVYAYGHAKNNPWIYLCRAPTELAATHLNAYEYWNGQSWQRERLTRDGDANDKDSNKLGESQSVFWQIQQGQVVWSIYLSCFIFVYCDAWWTNQVLIKTSARPEGPWSEPITLFKADLVQEDGGCIYSAIPHPYYDPSGKTLIITFTNHPNTIQAIKITFA